MTTWAPVSGTFPHYGTRHSRSWLPKIWWTYSIAARWVDPAFGFAVGWVSSLWLPVNFLLIGDRRTISTDMRMWNNSSIRVRRWTVRQNQYSHGNICYCGCVELLGLQCMCLDPFSFRLITLFEGQTCTRIYYRESSDHPNTFANRSSGSMYSSL